ncbi:MAG: DNA translocase FtsK 4TM domain-containing protein [Eubacterium sp.]
MATKKQTRSKSTSSSASRSRTAAQKSVSAERGVIDNIWGVILIALGAFIFVAVQFKAAGEVGDVIGQFLRGAFGVIGIVLPFYLIGFGLMLLLKKAAHISGLSVFLCVLVFLMMCTLNSIRFFDGSTLPDFDVKTFYTDGIALNSGGAVGMMLDYVLIKAIGKTGVIIAAIAIIFICLLLVLNTPVSKAIENHRQKREDKAARIEMQRRDEEERHAQELELRSKELERRRKEEEQRLKDQRKQDYLEAKIKLQQERNGGSAAKTAPTLIPNPASQAGIYTDKSQAAKSIPVTGTGVGAPQTSSLLGAAGAAPSAHERTDAEKKAFIEFVSDENNIGGDSVSPLQNGVPVDEPSASRVISYGLEPETEPAKGYGLEAETSSAKSYGLEPEASSAEGYGLSADVSASGTTNISGGKSYGLTDDDFYDPSAGTSSDSFDPFTDGPVSSDVLGRFDRPGISGSEGAGGNAGAAYAAGAAGTAKEGAAKLSSKEAREAKLDESDFNKVNTAKYKKPPLRLLKAPKYRAGQTESGAVLQARANVLEETLRNFNVDADVVKVTVGPAVTRYEVKPAIGVKVSKISSLSDDIAMRMKAKSIRIEAPIPGKDAVGIEIENDKITTVSLREIIESDAFQNAKSKISFAVGRDISGNSIVANLKDMPHLLIAGSTGSGKSVCINSIIMSFLYKADPDEVKLVLIDPKVVELGDYNGIPHLLIPVVTDPSKAAAALNWAVTEMTDRYKKFAETHVRDLESYNTKMRSTGEADKVMPQVVIIVDELADLMMAAPSQVEESICRLAQMARAAGMHLIVATQRPSVDVVTGLIKANIPSRIAFAVSSQFDSRTILDTGGAEKLVGKGDMLFAPMGKKPLRVQGCFVSDAEIRDVIDYVKKQVEDVSYSSDIVDRIERGQVGSGNGSSGDDSDELINDAEDCVVKAGQASVSMLQRRFRIGYNRAARIMDDLEARGVVGPQDGSHPRQVLLSEDELALRRAGSEDVEY